MTAVAESELNLLALIVMRVNLVFITSRLKCFKVCSVFNDELLNLVEFLQQAACMCCAEHGG